MSVGSAHEEVVEVAKPDLVLSVERLRAGPGVTAAENAESRRDDAEAQDHHPLRLLCGSLHSLR